MKLSKLDTDISKLSIAEIKRIIGCLSLSELKTYEKVFTGDTRNGVHSLFYSALKAKEKEEAEIQRVNNLYDFELEIARNKIPSVQAPVILGLDEVGRGPIAGPLAVGGVVLCRTKHIGGLNDSKKIAHPKREHIADEIKQLAVAYTVEFIEPQEIDLNGMSSSLKKAFGNAIISIEALGIIPDLILLDGNPLHLDSREVNVIKGDSKCASIAAASIIAKESRDALMIQYAKEYPQYYLEDCKGYASPAHIEAIKTHGLSPIHRKSFCKNFLQESLF